MPTTVKVLPVLDWTHVTFALEEKEGGIEVSAALFLRYNNMLRQFREVRDEFLLAIKE